MYFLLSALVSHCNTSKHKIHDAEPHKDHSKYESSSCGGDGGSSQHMVSVVADIQLGSGRWSPPCDWDQWQLSPAAMSWHLIRH